MRGHRRAESLQISLLSRFLQIWLLPRIRSFRRQHPDIELRFQHSLSLVDFSRSENHVAIRFGRGGYPNMHSEKLLDDWLVPVASPDLIKQHGMIERGEALSKFPLLESGDEPWHVWAQASEEEAWHSRSPSIEDSAGLLAGAEEGLGYALGRWTLVSRELQKGTLKLAGRGALAYGSAYWFVCPKSFFALPKVALFREWIFAAAKAFPAPPA